MQTRRLAILYRHAVYACMYKQEDEMNIQKLSVFTQNKNYLLALMFFKTGMTFFLLWKIKCVFLATCQYDE